MDFLSKNPCAILWGGAIVDLGCGSGEFLKYLRLMKRDCIGVDSNKFFVMQLRSMGLKVVHDNIITLEKIPNVIENAVIDNVLEHFSKTEIIDFFITLRSKMCDEGTLVIIVPDKKGFKLDPTHNTFIDSTFIQKICSEYNISLESNFTHPLNFPFVGNFLYLNMQVFTLRFYSV